MPLQENPFTRGRPGSAQADDGLASSICRRDAIRRCPFVPSGSTVQYRMYAAFPFARVYVSAAVRTAQRDSLLCQNKSS